MGSQVVALCLAFSPTAPSVHVGWQRRCSLTKMSIEVERVQTNSRRSVLLASALGLVAIPAASQAASQLNENAKSADIAIITDIDYLQGNDDAMAIIAKRTAEKNEAARIAAIGNIKTAAELQAEQEEAKFKIALAGVGGTLVSSLFFYENLRRLYIKFSSGGRDSGYGTAADNNYRRSKASKKEQGQQEEKPILAKLLGF